MFRRHSTGTLRGSHHCGQRMRNVYFPPSIMTHVVSWNVITTIRIEPSTLLMGFTCFKLPCGVCKQSETEEEEERIEDAKEILDVLFVF